MPYPEMNAIIAKSAFSSLRSLISRDDIGEFLRELDYDWSRNTFNSKAAIVPELEAQGFVERHGSLLGVNRMGLLFLGRLLLHFDVKKLGIGIFGNLNDKYKDFQPLSMGKNSIVVEARHKVLDTRVVLKLIRPGASSEITKSVSRLSNLRADAVIVLPIDFLEVATVDLLGKPVSLGCLVFPFVEGITFREFLAQKNHHLNSQVVISFARQIGGSAPRALGADRRVPRRLARGQYSGGSVRAREGTRFKVVDISFDAMGSLPFEVCRNNDLSNYKQHLWRILSAQKLFMPRMSLRKYIGTRHYIRIMKVLSEETDSFFKVCGALASDSEFDQYLEAKKRFISERFRSPVSFRLQRYEEITDPTIAVKLFVPYKPLMEKITGFSNIYVSGNRGSGKSTYLAVTGVLSAS